MRKLLMVMVVALMASIGFAAPAQAAVSMPYSFAYGNSTASGTINFTDGYTASVSGVVHAASGQRQVCATGFNGDVVSDPPVRCSPWAYAGGPNPTWGGPLAISRPGGVVEVYLLMYDETDTARAGVVCTRGGCSRLQL
jgi:hypothetical protein